MFVTQQEPIIPIIIHSLILFNPWMFLLWVFVYLRGRKNRCFGYDLFDLYSI